MPRQLRLEYEGAAYHVIARGNRRESIFREDNDRLAWLDYLGQVCRRTGWRVYGWVLMRNHYHLLVETPGPIWSAACNGCRQPIRFGLIGVMV
jgi:putative transposase